MARLVMGPLVSRIAGKIGSVTFRQNATGASAMSASTAHVWLPRSKLYNGLLCPKPRSPGRL